MEHRQYVMSLSRLYKNKYVTEEKVLKMYEDKKITETEKEYILNCVSEK